VKYGKWGNVLGVLVTRVGKQVITDVSEYIARLVKYHLDGEVIIKPKHVTTPAIMDLKEEEPPPAGDPALPAYEAMQAKARHLLGAIGWARTESKKLAAVYTRISPFMSKMTPLAYLLCKVAIMHVHAYGDRTYHGHEEITSLILSSSPAVPFQLGRREAGLHTIYDGSPKGVAPNDTRPIVSCAIMLGYAAIEIITLREKTRTNGAHAAESAGAVQAVNHTLPVRGLLHELFVPQAAPSPIYTDAQSVLFQTQGGPSIRKTPWLLARLEAVLDAEESDQVKFKKVSGTLNPTNSLTKYTTGPEFFRDIRFLTNDPSFQKDDVVTNTKDKTELGGLAAMLESHVPADVSDA